MAQPTWSMKVIFSQFEQTGFLLKHTTLKKCNMGQRKMEPLKEETPFLQLWGLRLFIPPMTDPWGWIIYLLKKVTNSHMNKGTWLGTYILQGSYRYLITYLVFRVEFDRKETQNKHGQQNWQGRCYENIS